MAKVRQGIWLSGALLAAVTFVGACGDDDVMPQGTAGTGGNAGHPGAGQAGDAQAGNAQAGNAQAGDKSGGQAGQGQAGQGQAGAPCVDGLQVLKVVASAADSIISWPAQHRVAINVIEQGVLIYELEPSGELTLLETLRPQDLGLDEGGYVGTLVRYGEGFVAQTWEGAERRIVIWQPDGELDVVPYPEFEPAWGSITAADPEIGIAGETAEGIRLAKLDGQTWTWSPPIVGERHMRPLALEADRMLVGVEEYYRLGFGGSPGQAGASAGGAAGFDGGASTGGAAGETGTPDPQIDRIAASVEWWSLQGTRLETHKATGNPQVALKVAEGWLIGETNSFWGSYQAGIELLPSTGELRKLTDVPVQSGGDGTDGAYDLARLGSRLLVANCESGLRAGPWSSTKLELETLPGPWQPEDSYGTCSPTQLEVLDDLVVVGGDNIVFARACE